VKAQKTKAVIRTSMIVKDKATGNKLHEDSGSKVKQLTLDFEEKSTGVVKVSNRIGMSARYQSVDLVVGVDLPWPCRPGHVEDMRAGFEAAYNFIDDELASRAKEMEGVLRDLSKKYGH
jgi:hypothetical protein